MSILSRRLIQRLALGANHAPNAEITVNGFVDAFTTTTDLVPQQGTATKLDTLGDKIMTPVVYQNRAGTESLWADSTVVSELPQRADGGSLVSIRCHGRQFPCYSGSTTRLEQCQRRLMALDAQHRRGSKWKHCHRLFHFQHDNLP